MILIQLCGCESGIIKGPSGPPIRDSRNYPSLICEYLEFVGLTSSLDTTDYRTVVLTVTPGSSIRETYWESEDGSSVNREGLFERLCVARGDTCFNESAPTWTDLYYNTVFMKAFREDVIGIKSYAISDFDDKHPAGCDLTDITYLTYCSLYDFVGNNYSFNENRLGNGAFPLVNEVAEINTFYPGIVDRRTNALFNILYHRNCNDITVENPIRMIPPDNDWIVSFSEKPAHVCEVELSVTVQIPIKGYYPSKTYTTRFTVE